MSIMALRVRMRNQDGFTLVELIVVMAIIALLAALAVPKFMGIVDDSKTKADQANRDMLNSAKDLYETNENATLSALDTLVTAGYLKAIPINPTTNAAYTLDDLGG